MIPRGAYCRPLSSFFEELLGRLVATTVPQDVEDVIIMIHRPPQVMTSAMDGQNHLVDMLMVSGPGPTTLQLIGVLLIKLATPLADRFVGHHDSAFEQQLLDSTVAQAQATREPDGMTDDLEWTSVMYVGGG
jgi:hypothetical protein